MASFIFGVLLVLHGLVHLLYFGQSARYFDLRPGMVWPDGSWAFSRLLGDGTTRSLASIVLILVSLGFLLGGAGVFSRQPWSRPAVMAAAAFSTILYLLFWDGKIQALDDQGGIGLLINLAILAALLIL